MTKYYKFNKPGSSQYGAGVHESVVCGRTPSHLPVVLVLLLLIFPLLLL